MALITIDQEKCKRDGICEAVCPMALIMNNKDEVPQLIDNAENLCIACGHCVAACPTAALSHSVMTPEQCPPIQKELLLTPQQCEHFLRSRRSMRVFKDKNVTKEQIIGLIKTARYAPSGYNSQCVEWKIIQGKERLAGLGSLVLDWMRYMIGKMPEMAEKFQMPRNVKRFEAGEDVILRNAPMVVVAHAYKDESTAPAACTIALTYLELAAPSSGLGACWAGYFNSAANFYPPMKEALALPEGHQCFGAMMIGVPKVKYQRLPARRQPKITWDN